MSPCRFPATGSKLWRWGPGIAIACLVSTPVVAQQSAPTTYAVDAKSSRFIVEVGRAGFLKMFGHDHTIVVERFAGAIHWDEQAPSDSSFTLEVDAASLTVADDEVSEEERRSVQRDMEVKALGLPAHAKIRFESTSVKMTKINPVTLDVKGLLDLRGVRKEIQIPVELEFQEAAVVARGEFEIQGKDFGVPQVAAAGGAVKTRNELELAFEIRAVARPER